MIITGILIGISCSKDDDVPEVDTAYAVFAWNDLGMHCLNPTYNELVILPPYNTVNVQVVRKGNPPQVVTSGLTVEYNILNNTSSVGKREYGGFWTHFTALFGGTKPANDIGLTGTGLAGTMKPKSDHFSAEGMPVVPVNDAGTWDPYQVIEVKVKDGSGNLLATTRATVPVSDEIDCAKCHSGGTSTAFTNILKAHDEEENTTLVSLKPVLCAKCHGSPALGTTGPGSSGKYFSQAIHGSHATRGASCYDCHPGNTTKCSRSSAHMGASGTGNCVQCHGDMANVALSIKSGRVPWVSEPGCATCHSGVTGVATNATLYRNATGHGNLYCTACHGSPHAMYPSAEAKDNFQPDQYQGSKIKSIGSCGVCHKDSRGEDDPEEFMEKHGGTKPDKKTSCHVCHTAVSGNTASWPHGYSWKNSN